MSEWVREVENKCGYDTKETEHQRQPHGMTQVFLQWILGFTQECEPEIDVFQAVMFRVMCS